MLATLLLLATTASASSIYNPFDPIPGKKEPGARASVNLSVEIDRGNLERTQTKSGAGFEYVHHQMEYKLIGQTHQAVTFDERTAGTNFLHTRLTRQLGQGSFWGYGFAQVDNNVFKLVTLRNVNGLGVELRRYPTESFSFNIATSMMSEYTRYADGAIDDDAGLRWRNSTIASLSLKLGDRMSAGATAFYQPRLDAPLANVRSMGQATWVVDLSPPTRTTDDGEEVERRVVSKVRFDLRVDHDSQPPPDVQPTDIGFDTSLSFQWH